jgi:hypothetical protein
MNLSDVSGDFQMVYQIYVVATDASSFASA